MTEMKTFLPKTRAEWFIPDVGLVRKNFCGWDPKGDLPLPGVRVCVYGYYNKKYDPVAEIAEANWAQYCGRHGYALRTYPGGFTDTEDGDRMHDPERGEARFPLYYDIRGIFDIVMYLDIDSLFVNMDVRIEQLIDRGDITNPPTYATRFLWTFDDNGPNTSLLIARTDDTTEQHLRYAYEYAKNNNNVRHDRIERGGISDQDAMTALMSRPPFSHTFGNCFAASEVGIAYKEADVTPQTWIRSYAGMSLDDKLAAMKERAGV
jgi:hypothetical protein